MGGNFKSPYRGLQSWRNWREIVMGGGIPWLLRDEFTDVRAAGAVNGTPATPGPGTRVVADAGNRMTVGAGLFSVAGGGNDSTDYLRYAQVARVAGRVLIGRNINTANVIGGRHHVAWSVNAGNYNNLVGYLFASGGGLGLFINTLGNGAGAIFVSTYANGENVTVAMIQRAAGMYFMRLDSGAWILDYVYSSGANDLYPRTSGFKAYSVDALRIPDALYLPTSLAYDTFTRANGALGSSEAAGPDGQEISVRPWNNRVGTTLVAGNTASASALIGGIAIATVDTGTADVLQGAELTRAGGNVGVVVRYADATNYVIGYHDGINAKLDKVVAGVTTPVITAAAAYGAGRVLWIICEGTQFSLYYNDVEIGATGTINDASLQNGTEQGLYSTNVGNSQDDMLTMARGTNGEYDGLNRYGG